MDTYEGDTNSPLGYDGLDTEYSVLVLILLICLLVPFLGQVDAYKCRQTMGTERYTEVQSNRLG